MREDSTACILRRLSSRKIYNHIDPTFLLNKSDWEKIAVKPEAVPNNLEYLLIYSLNGGEFVSKTIKYLKKKLNINLVSINVKAYNKYNADFCL